MKTEEQKKYERACRLVNRQETVTAVYLDDHAGIEWTAHEMAKRLKKGVIKYDVKGHRQWYIYAFVDDSLAKLIARNCRLERSDLGDCWTPEREPLMVYIDRVFTTVKDSTFPDESSWWTIQYVDDVHGNRRFERKTTQNEAA